MADKIHSEFPKLEFCGMTVVPTCIPKSVTTSECIGYYEEYTLWRTSNIETKEFLWAEVREEGEPARVFINEQCARDFIIEKLLIKHQ